ncbi:MAG: glycosyltransferase family 4 protein, partial [Elusimicrobia bacterium]|nr:glycosyltransferase family 4 protein [Elusimicrobiota bacterium]
RTPLGGGGAVGVQLARAWAQMRELRLTVLGSGPQPPADGVDYHRLPGDDLDLVKLSELGYARFCRRFEAAATAWLRSRPRAGGECVVVNDISESPDLRQLSAAGYPIVSIWHVDVVDYFNRMYFRGLLRPERVVGAFESVRPWAGWAVPDVLQLVFEKQRQAVWHSRRLVVPSRAMVDTLQRCYPRGNRLAERCVVAPWGAWTEALDGEVVRARAEELRRHYQVDAGTSVLVTLSRLSPEKGVHLLLAALERLEASGRAPRDLCLFICGEAAFMQGAAYERRLRRLAARLTRCRVFFPGYVAGEEKAAFLSLAHLFVSPSLHESYGLTMVEALRAGRPVLASDHYGAREVFGPPEAADPRRGFGRLVRYAEGDPPGRLAAELEGLLADPAGLRAMGERARAAAAGMEFASAARSVADAALECASAAGRS